MKSLLEDAFGINAPGRKRIERREKEASCTEKLGCYSVPKKALANPTETVKF